MLKYAFVLALMLALTRYVPVYYNSSLYKDFVQQETQSLRVQSQLKWILVNKAKSYTLPVTEENISIDKAGSVMRVAVDYRVPVDFYFFEHELAFHVVASGSVRQ